MSDSQTDDASRLLELHQTVLDAHRQSDVSLILQDETDNYTIANRGEISQPMMEERRQRLGPYLEATNFEVYRDEVPPVVKVSHDGSLGWVIVQVFASGSQKTAGGEVVPIEFTSAWIELYEKQNGRWLRIGNVSNFKA